MTTHAAKPAERKTTPWGSASLLDEVRVAQRAGDKHFATIVQLRKCGMYTSDCTDRFSTLTRRSFSRALRPRS